MVASPVRLAYNERIASIPHSENDIRAQKRDTTEPAIVAALEALGCTVDRLDGGNGRPDLLCGEPRNHSAFLIECKSPGGRLTPKQKKYHAWSQGRIHLIETPQQAIEVAAAYMRGEF